MFIQHHIFDVSCQIYFLSTKKFTGFGGGAAGIFCFEFDFEIMPQDSELEVEERSEFSDFDNNYDDKPVEIPDADLDMASNFLKSLGEDLMQEDILQFL